MSFKRSIGLMIQMTGSKSSSLKSRGWLYLFSLTAHRLRHGARPNMRQSYRQSRTEAFARIRFFFIRMGETKGHILLNGAHALDVTGYTSDQIAKMILDRVARLENKLRIKKRPLFPQKFSWRVFASFAIPSTFLIFLANIEQPLINQDWSFTLGILTAILGIICVWNAGKSPFPVEWQKPKDKQPLPQPSDMECEQCSINEVYICKLRSHLSDLEQYYQQRVHEQTTALREERIIVHRSLWMLWTLILCHLVFQLSLKHIGSINDINIGFISSDFKWRQLTELQSYVGHVILWVVYGAVAIIFALGLSRKASQKYRRRHRSILGLLVPLLFGVITLGELVVSEASQIFPSLENPTTNAEYGTFYLIERILVVPLVCWMAAAFSLRKSKNSERR